MNPIEAFRLETEERIKNQGQNQAVKVAAESFNLESNRSKYSYNFKWMGRPIIQFPQDMIAMQELIWAIKPELIIETGIAHGGSLIYYASLLELIGEGSVVGVDIDIRIHNRSEIEKHPMAKRIQMIQGSSIDNGVVSQVKELAKGKDRILVCLDSNHSHDHVLHELNLYSPFVTRGSYLVVFDTIVEDLPVDFVKDRPWNKGNNPKTAIATFLENANDFVVDNDIDNKLLISVNPGGYLRRL